MNSTKDIFKVGAAVKSLLTQAGLANNKVFAIVAPEGAVKNGENYVVYKHVKSDFEYGKPVDFLSTTAVVGINAWSASVDGATALAEQVYDALQEHRGDIAGLAIQEVRLVDVGDLYDGEAPPEMFAKGMIFHIVF